MSLGREVGILIEMIPWDETARLRELHRYAILDTDADPAFDRVTGLAARMFGFPIVLVSLIDENRQWFKSCVGLATRETSREIAFCAHAIRLDEPLLIADATADERFRDNPLVTGPPHIRAYAGAQLRSPNGHALGTLCLIDERPRSLSGTEVHELKNLAAIVVDMIELHARTRDLAFARGQLEAILDSMDEVVVAVDRTGSTILFNRAAERTFGGASDSSRPEDWLAQTQILREDAKAPFPPEELPIVRALQGETVSRQVVSLRPPGSDLRWHSVSARPIVDDGGAIVGSVSVGRDVTEERRLQESERLSARTDPLTQLGNRRALEDVLPHALARADRRGARPISVALFDVDHFKQVNDTAGHEVGDAVLVAIAQALRAAGRESDLTVRWGGEELLALLPECELEGARVFADRVRRTVESLAVEGRRVTISAGIAERRSGESFTEVVARADAGLYAAKRSGRNRVSEA